MLEHVETVWVGTVAAPGVVALLLLLLYTYLHQQTHSRFFRLWQVGWAAYTVSFALLILRHHALYPVLSLSADLLRFGFAWCVLAAARMVGRDAALRPGDAVIAAAAAAWWALASLQAQAAGAAGPARVLTTDFGVAVLLLAAAWRFFRYGRRRESLASQVCGFALAMWGVLLLLSAAFAVPGAGSSDGLADTIAILPQVLLGVAMLMLLTEQERRALQENLLAFSSLEVDQSRLLSADDLAPALQRVLTRLLGLVDAPSGALCIAPHWSPAIPSVSRGFAESTLQALAAANLPDSLMQLANRRGGLAVLELGDSGDAVSAEERLRLEEISTLLQREGVDTLAALALPTRKHALGVVLFGFRGRTLPASRIRLLNAFAHQIATTLENCIAMNDSQRRSREHALLTQIGQAISSRLDPDEVLLAIHYELGKLFDTRTFYVAFLEGDQIRFELQYEEGELLPKRTRNVANGITEHIIRTGQPLLVNADMDSVRARLGVVPLGQAAKSFCGVPILLNNRPSGVMVAMNYERENVYTERDLELMRTAAGQVSVAFENARLFAQEQRRARYLAFLNNISRTAISAQDSEQMLAAIVSEIQSNFQFEHIGIGIFDYLTKEIEIKAEAGTLARGLGKRVALGSGVIGRVARSGDTVLIQNPAEGRAAGVLAESRSVLCIPILYGEKLMGVLNVESTREQAFAQQEVMILRTLADLLATALHNAFVLQKLQQQSITDGLTGIKTRRFFLEAVQAEWKRASRTGRPFSVVLMDLDKFKDVNDTAGHLEGDLVLARVGRLLEQKCRQSNVVARYGGDEFIILMPETGVEQAQVLSERLRVWIATDPVLNERAITGSFGVATFPLHGTTVEDIIRVADAGMYVCKHAGGNQVATAEQFGETPSLVAQKQLILTYLQKFLEGDAANADEIVLTLRRLGESEQGAGALREAVLVLARASETRESHAAGHAEAVARIVEAIGRELALGDAELQDLVFAARVHDVGKIAIPERLLNKAAALEPDEQAMVRMHPLLGAQILEVVPGSARICEYVRLHHERLDGSGYPHGLRGDEIPLGARILGLAETYINMRTDRPYAAARTLAEAVAELENVSGVHLDGMLVHILLRQLRGEQVASVGK